MNRLCFCTRRLLLPIPTNGVLLSSINILLSSEAGSAITSSSKRNSDLIFSFLKSHGFTHTQISKLIRVRPQFISANHKKTLLPKLQFLQSIGLSTPQLTKIISTNPALLIRSVQNQLLPCYTFLKAILVLDQHMVKMLNRNSRILLHDVDKRIAPNISALKAIGVPHSLILFMLFNFPTVAHQDHAKFNRCLEEVLKMGFNPLRCSFLQALQVVVEMNKPTWDHKMEVYRRWGLSDDEIMIAFRNNPICMNLSEGKIMRGMDFLVNQMGWEVVEVMRCPVVLFYNLERRIVPRCRVIKALMSAGSVKKDLRLSYFLIPAEKQFLDMFVTKYEDNVPGLKKVYLGTEKGFGFEMK